MIHIIGRRDPIYITCRSESAEFFGGLLLVLQGRSSQWHGLGLLSLSIVAALARPAVTPVVCRQGQLDWTPLRPMLARSILFVLVLSMCRDMIETEVQ